MHAPGTTGRALRHFVQEDHSPLPFLHPHGVRLQPRQPIRQFRKFMEMCGENGTAADRRMQRLQHRPGDRQAVERRGAAADLVHHDQRARPGLMQDRGGLGHLHHEGGAAARQIVRRADTAEQPVHHADGGGFGGDRQAGLRQHDDQRVLAQEGGLAGHVGAGEQQDALLGREIAVVGHEGGVTGQGSLHHRVAAGIAPGTRRRR